MRATIILLLISIWIPVLSQNSDFPNAKPESVGIETYQLKMISDSLNKWFANDEIVGGEILIIKNSKTVFHEAVGWLDREDKKPFEKNTICRIRSMTKPFIGTATLL